MSIENKVKKHPVILLFLLGFVLGALLFVLTYGVKVLDVTYDAWIFRIKDVDIHQHYLGWCHFRACPWNFPPGLMDSLSYPYKISVLWTDSIPLFAMIFKCFRNVLPETFQYFGLYGLLSFALTGAFSAVLVHRITENPLFSLLSVPLFAESFPMLQRMFYHTSLTAHYLIIIPLLFILYGSCKWSVKKKCLLWGGYFFITVLLHPYLWAIGAVIAVSAFIYEIKITGNFNPALITGAVSALLTFTALWLCGAFYGNVTASYKLGGFEANLNCFINPLGFGRLLPELPLQGPNQYEGFAYLGAGGILLVLTALVFFIIFNSKVYWQKGSFIFILIPVFSLMAVFPDFTLNSKLLFSVKVPGMLERILGIFRSNGRFIWPALILLYLLSLMIIFYTGWEKKKALPYVVLVLCLVLQFADMSAFISGTREQYGEIKKPWHSDLEDPVLMEKLSQYNHIVLVTPDSYRMERSAYFAVKNGLTVNRFYFARNIDDEINETLSSYHDSCREGQTPDNVIFVFDEETMDEWKNDTSLHFYDLSGTIVGLKDELPLPELK